METTELIERYLEGSLSSAEKIEVEQKAQTDAQFRKLIDLHRQVNESIADEELHDLHQKIRQILNGRKEEIPLFRRIYPVLKMAASFLIIAGAAVVIRFIFGYSAEERLYNRYYEPYEADVITRSVDAADLITRGIGLYNNKKYSEAFEVLSEHASSNPDNYLAWFFCGLTSMQLRNFDHAIKSFSQIPADWSHPFQEHASWYYALALLHEQRTQKAKILLYQISNQQGYYAKKSGALLSRLH